MKNLFGALLAASLLGACAAPPPAAPSAQSMTGTWTVDLRPKPGAPDYYQQLVISAVKGDTFEGTFYNTPITQGRFNTIWGTVRMGFVTEDGSGAYHHSAVLKDGKLEGLTNSTGRNFLAYWSATRP